MKKHIVLFLAIALLGLNTAYGELVPYLGGNFKLQPKAMHPTDITGKMSLLFEGKDFSLVRMNLDQPVMRKSIYESKEQVMVTTQISENQTQIAVVFKLNGPIHKWYFVLVMNSKNIPSIYGTVFEGSFYKVLASMEDILLLLKDGVKDIPPEWAPIGTAELAKIIE